MQNPLPESESGYGNGAGLRIVYQLIRCSDHMLVAVIGVREDDEVYELERILKHDLQTKRNGRHLPFLFVCITVCIL